MLIASGLTRLRAHGFPKDSFNGNSLPAWHDQVQWHKDELGQPLANDKISIPGHRVVDSERAEAFAEDHVRDAWPD
jgi:hypothetical protein